VSLKRYLIYENAREGILQSKGCMELGRPVFNEYCGLWAERSRIRLPAETIFSALQTVQTSPKPRPVSCSIVTDVLSQE
jgi:hypothetical protein